MQLILDRDAFGHLQAKVRQLVKLEVTASDRVITNCTWPCRFCSFDMCFSPDLLGTAIRLCEASGDQAIWFSMLDPDPINYYYNTFRRFGAVAIDTGEDIDSAWSAFEEVPGDSPADALIYRVDRFVIISASMTWVVWGDRNQDAIICAAQHDDQLMDFSCGRCQVVDLEDALSEFLDQSEGFADAMRTNYLML